MGSWATVALFDCENWMDGSCLLDGRVNEGRSHLMPQRAADPRLSQHEQVRCTIHVLRHKEAQMHAHTMSSPRPSYVLRASRGHELAMNRQPQTCAHVVTTMSPS